MSPSPTLARVVRTSLLPTVLSLVVASAGLAAATSADPGGTDTGSTAGHGRRTAHREHRTPLGYVQGTHKPQTSDGIIGDLVPQALRATRARPARPGTDRGRTTVRARWRVAPGVQATVVDHDGARGRVREYLLSISYRRRTLHLDTMNSGPVRAVDTVLHQARRAHAVAGVNGDFYDIGDTGAPLGLNRNRHRGLLNGRLTGWNSAFYLDRDGRPEIGRLDVVSRIKEHPRLVITNLNSPTVDPGGVGVYTRAWGAADGYRVTDGASRHVRMVLVRRGRVVRTSTRLPGGGPIAGTMLVGRGAGADRLAGIRVGQPITYTSHLSSATRMALTGNQFLVQDGVIKVVDDREMEPRTAVGIDRDTHQVLLLVVDGRQSFSRGYTMVELADEMIDLGADEALNLDGGGSSTLVARRPGHGLGVVNSPSDGFQRLVANGLAVTSTPRSHSAHRAHHRRGR